METNTTTAPAYLEFVRKAETVMVAGLTAGVVGAIGGALSTEFVPADVGLSKDVDVEASFNLGKNGLTIQDRKDELGLPHAPVSTHIPGFDGVKLALPKSNIIQELEQTIINPQQEKPAAFKQLTTLAAHPETAIIRPVEEALAARVVEGALAAPLMLAVGAVALKRYQPFARLSNLTRRLADERSRPLPPKLSPAALGALTLAGCGFGGNAIIEKIDSVGSPLPAQIANRSPYFKDATIKEEDLKLANRVVYTLDRGRLAWQKIDVNLETELDKYAARGGLAYIGNSKITSELTSTSELCSHYYLSIVEPTLQSRLQSTVSEDAGDRFTSGDTWGYESDCEADFLKPITNAKSVFIGATGNHDGEPLSTDLNPKDNFTKTVDGVTYVTAPDPRSKRWGHPNQPLTQAGLNKLIGQQGSELAKRACAITDKTGVPPDIDVHTPEAGFESLIDGCAQNISSGHGVQAGDSEKTDRPILTNYRVGNGNIVHQLINVTASGAANTSPFYDPPGRDGAVVLKEYRKSDHTLIKAVEIIFKKDLSVKIAEMKNPRPVAPTKFMRRFVDANSPTAHGILSYKP